MKKVWFAIALAAAWLCGAATVALAPLRGSDAPLEPSVQNEVDHAVSLAARAVERIAKDAKRETREELALRLVQTQRGDGTWEGDVLATTRANLAILEAL
ncbi:MAG: hypothetical protein IJ802_05245 [Kiritimatiellae bacterium]|nr:hypothetical protein [Kiritimatiellia bacterium]